LTFTILHGKNLEVLPTLADNSVDSIVTDPPYELGFMGKKWDSSGIAYSVELWAECLRVLKPGGHLLSFGGSRTYHRVAVAIEDAGFELRDSIAWLYGSGFPKSLDVSKAIDKTAGAEREILTESVTDLFGERQENQIKTAGMGSGKTFGMLQAEGQNSQAAKSFEVSAPSTPEAEQWNGWGTALKPAHEPIIVARKPLEGTVANNVLTHGTGALNIDGSRIGAEVRTNSPAGGAGLLDRNSFPNASSQTSKEVEGRWPANIILDEHTAGLLNEQSGVSKSTDSPRNNSARSNQSFGLEDKNVTGGHSDSGGASRFFYVAKASKRDRNEGLDAKASGSLNMRTDSHLVANGMETQPSKNSHPTVKPTALMEYLVKLVTPPNGTVLDPFTGSGSTGKAAILNGFDFIGIEMTEDYLPIIKARLEHAETEFAKAQADEGLF